MKKLVSLLSILSYLVFALLCVASCDIGEQQEGHYVKFINDGLTYGSFVTNGKGNITLPNEPAKKGYTFDGWYLDEGTWNQSFTSGRGITEDLTVYAKWIPVEYTATFLADDQSIATITYTMENSALENIPLVPDKKGYIGEWEEYMIKAEGITVHAIYTPKQYTITYVDSHKAQNSNPASYTIETDTFVLEDLTKDKYIFDGWYDGETKVTEIVQGTHGDITLTAKWTRAYYVTFIKGASAGERSQIAVRSNTVVPASLMPAVPEKSGYIGEWIYDGSPITKDTQITPLYTPITYTITYDLGDANSISVAKNNANNPTTYTVEDAVIFLAPTREGYTFKGWDIATIKVGTIGNKTITAKWQVNEYTITYDLNDSGSYSKGVNFVSNPPKYTIEDDVVFGAPAREGYTFKGWDIAEIHVGTIGNQNITATWEVNTYTITYDLCDANSVSVAKNNANNPTAYTVEDAATFLAPTREGYTFKGWDIAEIQAGTIGNQTITAVWDVIQYQIDYQLAGDEQYPATNGENNPLTFTVEDIIILQEPTRLGYDFVAWKCGENDIDSISLGTAENIALSAIWQEKFEYVLSDDETYYIIQGIGTITAKNIVIPTTYNGKPVKVIGDSAFESNFNITSVTIPDNITHIGKRAFFGCFQLTSLTFPEGVASIGYEAFYNCYKFIEIHSTTDTAFVSAQISSYVQHVIDDENDSYLTTTNEGYIFYEDGVVSYLMAYIGEATELTLPTKSPTGKTYEIYQYAFYHNVTLKSVTIPSGITTIGKNSFCNCSGLISVIIPEGVTDIGNGAFRNCTGLTSLSFPQSMTSVSDYLVNGCANLTSITFSDNVTNIGSYVFSGCNKLRENIAGVIYIGKWVVDGDESISTANIREGTTIILESAFNSCKNLTSLSLPASIKTIGNKAFYYTSLTSISLEKGSTTFHCVNNCLIDTASKTLVLGCKSSVIPADGSVTSIGKYAFYGCLSLSNIVISEGVITIEDNAFAGCGNLISVTLPSTLQTIGVSAFDSCHLLSSVVIPASTTTIETMAFSQCDAFTSIIIPISVTTMGSKVFYSNDNLTEIKCEAVSQPVGWKSNWRDSTMNATVTWGYTAD